MLARRLAQRQSALRRQRRAARSAGPPTRWTSRTRQPPPSSGSRRARTPGPIPQEADLRRNAEATCLVFECSPLTGVPLGALLLQLAIEQVAERLEQRCEAHLAWRRALSHTKPSCGTPTRSTPAGRRLMRRGVGCAISGRLPRACRMRRPWTASRTYPRFCWRPPGIDPTRLGRSAAPSRPRRWR